MKRWVRRMCAVLVAAVFFAGSAAEALAGGWPLPQGDAEVILNISHLTAKELYDSSGNKRSKSRYRKLEISPYAEYGLTDDLTLIGEFAWMEESTNFFGRYIRDSGFLRAKLGARQVLGEWEDTLFSVQPVATFHLAGDTNDPAATGSGDTDLELGLVLARNEKVLGLPFFSVQELAWRYRDNGRPDELRADVTLGTKPWDGTMLLLKSLNTGALDMTANGDLYRSSKIAFSVVQDLPRADAPGWAIEVGLERTVFGRSAAEESTFRLALWHHF